MLRALLQVTGIEQRLHALTAAIEARAEDLVREGKSLALQLAVAAGLAIAAVTLLLLAFIGGLVALYLWLAPQIGSLAATGVVVAVLVFLAAIFALASLVVARQKGPPPERAISDRPAPADASEPAEATGVVVAPAPPLVPDPIPESPLRVTPVEADALLSLSRRFVSVPQTGVAPLDEFLTTLTPRAEEAAKDAVLRAANLVRHGDRSMMFTILGTAVATGWLLTKVRQSRSA